MPIHPTPPREANSPLALGKPQRFWALLPLHGLRGLAGLEGWDRGRGVSGCTVGKTNLTTVRCSQGSACLKTPSLQKRPQGGQGWRAETAELWESLCAYRWQSRRGRRAAGGEPGLPSFLSGSSQGPSPCRTCLWCHAHSCFLWSLILLEADLTSGVTRALCATV